MSLLGSTAPLSYYEEDHGVGGAVLYEALIPDTNMIMEIKRNLLYARIT